MNEQLSQILERWGFPVLVAVAAGWILRNDVLLPLVDEHRAFVKQLGETQKDISKAVMEQTKLLYALQPKDARSFQARSSDPGTEGAN